MKKYILYPLYMLAIVLLATACSDSKDLDMVDLIVEANIPTSPLAAEGSIELYTEDYTAESLAEWCTITTEGKFIKLKLGNNASYVNRFTAIEVTHKGVKTSIAVTQLGLLFEFAAEAPNLLYSLRGGQRAFKMVRNVPFEVVPSNDWIGYEIKGDSIKVIAPANATAREGFVTLKYANQEMKLPVKQKLIYTYDELLGDAQMQYKNKDGVIITQDVKLSANVVEKTFWLTADFPKLGETKIEIGYNIMEGSMHIYGAQVLKPFKDPDYDAVKYAGLSFHDNNPTDPASTSAEGKLISYDGFDAFDKDYVNVTFKRKPAAWISGLVVALQKVRNLEGMTINGRRGASVIAGNKVTGTDYVFIYDLVISKK